MAAGRTSWFPRDAAWHRRELIVELGDEFGGNTIAVLSVIDAWAQEQRAGGEVKGGYRILAREAFVTVGHAESIVARAAELGVLDDLEVADDGRRFTCRVSGWGSDQERGKAAFRKASQRERDRDVTDSHGESRDVPDSHLPDLTREDKTNNNAAMPQRSRALGTSRSLAETVACPRCGVPAGEKCDGVRKKRESCHLERHHAVGELLDVQPKRARRPAPSQAPMSSLALAAEYRRVSSEDQFCAHFPDVPRSIVLRAVKEINAAGEQATVESVSARLDVAA